MFHLNELHYMLIRFLCNLGMNVNDVDMTFQRVFEWEPNERVLDHMAVVRENFCFLSQYTRAFCRENQMYKNYDNVTIMGRNNGKNTFWVVLNNGRI